MFLKASQSFVSSAFHEFSFLVLGGKGTNASKIVCTNLPSDCTRELATRINVESLKRPKFPLDSGSKNMIHCEMEEQIDYGKSGQTKRNEKLSVGRHLVLKLQIMWLLLVSREGAGLGPMASLTVLILGGFTTQITVLTSYPAC